MAALPYFPFYPADWLSDPDVTALSLEEQGAYIRLLANMWMSGHGRCDLPDEDQATARILSVTVKEWQAIKKALLPVLTISGGRVSNKRLSSQFEHAEQVASTKTGNGQKGGRPKKATAIRPVSPDKPDGNRPVSVDKADGSSTETGRADMSEVNPENPESLPPGTTYPSVVNADDALKNPNPVGALIDRWRSEPGLPQDHGTDQRWFPGLWRTYGPTLKLPAMIDAIGDLAAAHSAAPLDDPRKYLAGMLKQRRDETRAAERKRAEAEAREAEKLRRILAPQPVATPERQAKNIEILASVRERYAAQVAASRVDIPDPIASVTLPDEQFGDEEVPF